MPADAGVNTPRTAQQALAPTADPAWVLAQQGFDPLRDTSRESRFAISNGFLGVRGGRTIDRLPKTTLAPRTYVAGLFDSVGAGQPLSALVPAPDWLRIEISLASPGDSAAIDDVSFHSRTLDIRRGALVTESRVERRPGLEVRLRVLRLVSLHSRGLGLQVIELEIVAGTVEATLVASFEGLQFGLVAERLEQGLGVWHTHTTGKRLAMAASATLREGDRVIAAKPLGPLQWSWRWTTQPGQVLQFERIVAVALGDTQTGNTVEQAQDQLAAAEALGWAGILGRHEASWADRWRASDVVVGGDPAAQQALRFALYHLNGAANPQDESVSVAARALTGADYHGHVFWDTEIFLLPFYTLTWPQAARALADCIASIRWTPRAPRPASMGWRGATVRLGVRRHRRGTCTPDHAIGPGPPRRRRSSAARRNSISARISPTPSGSTGRQPRTRAFLRDAGAEILLETARFWASRAQLEGGRAAPHTRA